MVCRELEYGWTSKDAGDRVDFFDEDGDIIFYAASACCATVGQCNELVRIWRQGFKKGQTSGINTAQKTIRLALGMRE